MTEVEEAQNTNHLLHMVDPVTTIHSEPSSVTSERHSDDESTSESNKNPWKEFDMLTAVVTRYHMPLEAASLAPHPLGAMTVAIPPPTSIPNSNNGSANDHRISCHRCGNIRKRKTVCCRANCPHTFCGRCSDKLRLEYGPEVFSNGCPVCKDLCCCSNKSVNCLRKFHCYRKCPATKVSPKNSTVSSASSPTALSTTIASTLNEGSNDESTSVEDNSSVSIIGQKQQRMNALLEACATIDPANINNSAEGVRSNKRQRTAKPLEDPTPFAIMGIDPAVCGTSSANPKVALKKEKKSLTSSAAAAVASGLPMASYSMPFYGFPPTAMAAAGPYGMIPLVPAHMFSGYAQYSKMAMDNLETMEEKNNAQFMYGKGHVPSLIPFFPYYMPQYPPSSNTTHAQSGKVTKSKVPSVTQSNGINLLAAVSSHYLSDEEKDKTPEVTLN